VDPLSLAAVAVGLLVPLFKQTADKLAERAGEAIADAALPKLKALYDRVRAKLAPGSYQAALLDGVEAEPDDPARQEVLKAELAKLLREDRQFAADLERLVGEAEAAGGARITATDTGVVAGRDAHLHGQYVSGRDMTVGSPTEPPPQP
jgi:hypothetical protein